MIKKELRKKYTQKRKTLSKDEVLLLSQQIFEQFKKKFPVTENQKAHCFFSISEKNEVDTQFLLNYFFENKVRVFVPKIVDGKLISVEIKKDSVLRKNFWGILEPESNVDSEERNFDFVITPLLYCDKNGNRIGYGKGFYDEFFSKTNSETLKIGVNYFQPDEKIDDISETDIPLDYLVIPIDVLSFGDLTSNS